jgi:hypothetical protein
LKSDRLNECVLLKRRQRDVPPSLYEADMLKNTQIERMEMKDKKAYVIHEA